MPEDERELPRSACAAEQAILDSWALRFDGWKYCQETSWAEPERDKALDVMIKEVVPPSDILRQFALFFMLQRWLSKWGGETSDLRSNEWRAYRTLFLMTAGHGVEPRWRHGRWHERWQCEFLPHASQCIAIVARSHAIGYPSSESHHHPIEVKDALEWYDLERYLFETVARRFRDNGELGGFDFFSIVIWKANRAKSRIARRLLDRVKTNTSDPGQVLDAQVRELTNALCRAPDDRSRLQVLMSEYGFRLPMASAILSVLWPAQFTVYDVRVCRRFPEFSNLDGIGRFENLWPKYEAYRKRVSDSGPAYLTLRDRDRFLWASDAIQQLRADISRGFVSSNV